MKVYTHAGLFHADEIFAVAILVLAGETEERSDIIRLQKLNNIPNDGIIVDIGRTLDPNNQAFDHHQGFLTRADGYPYASAGLVWDNFGDAVIEKLFSGLNQQEIQHVIKYVDERLIKGLDAHDADNAYAHTAACSAGKVSILSISNLINLLNGSDITDNQEAFIRVLEQIAIPTLQLMIQRGVEHLRSEANFEAYFRLHEIDRIGILDKHFPWQEIVHSRCPDLLYLITPSTHPGGKYQLLAVTESPESRIVKHPIERSEEFTEFIHQGKWIAGSNSIESLEKLAIYNINRIPNETRKRWANRNIEEEVAVV